MAAAESQGCAQGVTSREMGSEAGWRVHQREQGERGQPPRGMRGCMHEAGAPSLAPRVRSGVRDVGGCTRPRAVRRLHVSIAAFDMGTWHVNMKPQFSTHRCGKDCSAWVQAAIAPGEVGSPLPRVHFPE